MSMDYDERSLLLHELQRGKLTIQSKVPLQTRDDLSVAYTPGVAEPCRRIAEDPDLSFRYTVRGNFVAVVSDGSAVLGLGDIGPEAALPVMEGKAILFREFGGVDAVPLVINERDPDRIVDLVAALSPTFAGINLEDISAPRAFEIEEKLQARLDIPVFHDDQHGTAIVILAGLINAAKVTGRELQDLRVVISGAGAAGRAVSRLLLCVGLDPRLCESVREILVCDRKGILTPDRADLNEVKHELAMRTNHERRSGSLQDALGGADVFIGVSAPGLLSADDVRRMAADPILFALANPDPEILPEEARRGGAAVVATGRSDFPNQVNNVLAFPGIFRGALDARATEINEAMKIRAARALARTVEDPAPDRIVPDPLDRSVAHVVATEVRKAAHDTGVARESN